MCVLCSNERENLSGHLDTMAKNHGNATKRKQKQKQSPQSRESYQETSFQDLRKSDAGGARRSLGSRPQKHKKKPESTKRAERILDEIARDFCERRRKHLVPQKPIPARTLLWAEMNEQKKRLGRRSGCVFGRDTDHQCECRCYNSRDGQLCSGCGHGACWHLLQGGAYEQKGLEPAPKINVRDKDDSIHSLKSLGQVNLSEAINSWNTMEQIALLDANSDSFDEESIDYDYIDNDEDEDDNDIANEMPEFTQGHSAVAPSQYQTAEDQMLSNVYERHPQVTTSKKGVRNPKTDVGQEPAVEPAFDNEVLRVKAMIQEVVPTSNVNKDKESLESQPQYNYHSMPAI